MKKYASCQYQQHVNIPLLVHCEINSAVLFLCRNFSLENFCFKFLHVIVVVHKILNRIFKEFGYVRRSYFSSPRAVREFSCCH